MLQLFVAAQVLAAHNAFAQVVHVTPSQSSNLPPPPAAPKDIPDIRIKPSGAAPEAGPAGPSIIVKSLRVSGETRFSEAQLLAVTGFTPGRALTLADLRRMAGLITKFYNEHGYIVAQAYLPAQEINDGAVTIVVVEGRYGALNLRNRSKLHDGVARGVLAGVKTGDLVEAAPLERRLLLLSDIPGVRVHSTLSPGAAVGTSDLTVDLTPGRTVSGDVEIDNAGNRYSGAVQGGGTVNFNEPLGIGDVASLRVLTSGRGMSYVRGSYQALVGKATVGAAYAYFHYRLGKEFSGLGANGDEQIASLYGSYPLIRSYDNNLELQVDADHRTFRDRIDIIPSRTERRANVVTVGLSGDHHDTFGGGGWDSYSAYVSGGDLDIRTPAARAADAASARTQGGYGKLRFSLDRLQTVRGPFAVYAAVRGQIASKNLDISEKMELGGAYGVRAYPEGEAYGDEGYLATLEGRLRLPRPWAGLPGRMQLIGFVDTGQVRYAKDPWAPGSNSAHRSGAGVGLTWADNANFVARVSYAHRLGSADSTSKPGSTDQFWFEIVKFF